MGNEVFYLTTPIYYVNDVPHIGHAYTTVAADFVARYHRLAGEEVFFLTGTDEHGQKVLRAAEEKGLAPEEWCDQIIPRWTEVWERLKISHDDFIRTTERRHIEPVTELVQKIYDAGDIYLGHYEGPYCVACEAFYQPSEIVNGLCPIHEKPVEMFQEENYFFRLSEFQDQLLELYEQRPQLIQPEIRRNEVISFVKAGLDDLSISRTSFDWGIPLPWDPKHVLYVWMDALPNYMTAVGLFRDEERFARTWPANYHFIGKDILRQHAVIWPAFLLAAGLPLPETVFAHGYLTVGGKKMSKTNLTGISPHVLLDTFGSDGYRYYFLREGSFGQDGSFSWEAVVARYNGELANDLGNLVSRVLALIDKHFEGKVPDPGDQTPEEETLQAALSKAAAELDTGVRSLNLAAAMSGVWEAVRACNHYVDRCAPWALAKDESQRERLGSVLYSAAEGIRQLSVLISPALPEAAQNIRDKLGVASPIAALDAEMRWGGLAAGTKISRGGSLFPKVETED